MQLAEHEHDLQDSELDAWRLRCLLDVGYKQHRAEQLAARRDIDLHVAVWLLARGCDQKTAMKILL